MLNIMLGFGISLMMIGSFIGGYIFSNKINVVKEVREKKVADKEVMKKAKMIQEGMNNVLSYDVDVAYGRRLEVENE